MSRSARRREPFTREVLMGLLFSVLVSFAPAAEPTGKVPPGPLDAIARFGRCLAARDLDGCLAVLLPPEDPAAADRLRRRIEARIGKWDPKKAIEVEVSAWNAPPVLIKTVR